MCKSEKTLFSAGCCKCGKVHRSTIDDVIVGKGVINQLPKVLSAYNVKKVFVLADKNTHKAAGERVCEILEKSRIPYSLYVMQQDVIEPNEETVGSVVMHYDNDCDITVVCGTGVLGDVTKIVSTFRNTKYIIVATAPSMDGFASNSASVIRDNLKETISTCTASVIIGDTDILSAAPMRMLLSGIGDMFAKYISICEWRLANLICSDYYCEEVAFLIRKALKECTDNAAGIMNREEKAVEAVFRGLVLGGEAMMYAGVTRPASGTEHYFSHIWDMRGLEKGTPVDLHGIQCAVGTYQTALVYERLKKFTPDREKAVSYFGHFDLEAWHQKLVDYIGVGGEMMKKAEEREGKYSVENHRNHLDVIISKWDEIIDIINVEIPSIEELDKLYDLLGMPKKLSDICLDDRDTHMVFCATKDIRDKYVGSRLAFELGVIDEIFADHT